MKTKVKIIFFKKYTGKYYTSDEYKSKFDTFESENITKEVENKYPKLSKLNFSIEVENDNRWNQWLVYRN